MICPEDAIVSGTTAYDDDTALAVMLGVYCGLRRCEICVINMKHDIVEYRGHDALDTRQRA